MRTLSVSADDKTLTLVDVYTFVDGSGRKDMTKYARLSPGKGLFGASQSVSEDSQETGKPLKLVIEPFGKEGLSFVSPDYDRLDMNFDGKSYSAKGPGITKPSTASGKRISTNLIQIENQEDGKLEETTEYRISEDGKTMTIVVRPAASPAVFTNVYDRQ